MCGLIRRSSDGIGVGMSGDVGSSADEPWGDGQSWAPAVCELRFMWWSNSGLIIRSPIILWRNRTNGSSLKHTRHERHQIQGTLCFGEDAPKDTDKDKDKDRDVIITFSPYAESPSSGQRLRTRVNWTPFKDRSETYEDLSQSSRRMTRTPLSRLESLQSVVLSVHT